MKKIFVISNILVSRQSFGNETCFGSRKSVEKRKKYVAERNSNLGADMLKKLIK